MSKKIIIILVLVLIILGAIVLYTKFNSKDIDFVQPNNNEVSTTTIVYKNIEYGFTLDLPISWNGYSVTKTPIKSSDGKNLYGETVVLRYPKWKENAQTMDIPIQVFTIEQWNKWEAVDFDGYPTAAPIGPTERGRNSKFIFATAPRYNYSFATGFEEVEKIIGTLKGI